MSEKVKLTKEEIYAKKEFNFEKLLEPYREGGTENAPVKRTMGTKQDCLKLNRKLSANDFLLIDLRDCSREHFKDRKEIIHLLFQGLSITEQQQTLEKLLNA